MKNLVFGFLFICSFQVFAQEHKPIKMDVPTITLGENQNFDVLSYEAVSSNQFSIMYMQDLSATVVGDKEYVAPNNIGAYSQKIDEESYKDFVPYSNRILVLVRQTFDETDAGTTKFWVVAVRELQSSMSYTMHYPESFVHPIIADHVPVNYSLKNVDQIPDLTEREFAALVAVGKQKYGFYEYPAVSYQSTYSSLADDIQNMKSGFKELKAALGAGKMSLPKGENQLFKREVIDNIRLAATKTSSKESVELKIYISQSGESEYELLASKTYAGNTNPMFASALVYSYDLNILGAYGWTVVKPNDKNESPIIVVMGIDENGEPHFWEINSGKNGLNSFTPTFSYARPEGIYVVSLNRDKIFKPFYQHHLLKPDGTTETLFPTTPEEIGSEKSEFLSTEQKAASPSTGYQPTSTSGMTTVDVPVSIFERNNHRYIFETSKTTTTVGDMKNVQFGDLSVIHIDANNKILEDYDITQNKSSDMPFPMLLGDYSDKAYFLVNYPNMFKLVVSDAKVETETVENDTYKLVNQANGEYITFNQYGALFLTKSAIGNKTTLEFFPQN